uniref:ABC transporter domain-containing protein n=1 Tax=Helicotheca tamesis TaxID=374047 RepID=A0A7S2HUD0_9STRA
MLRLSKCAESPIMLVSGGEKKRVNIGTELLTDPSVIMLDEPTSGLDSTSAVALLKMLKGLARQRGKTVITSIHQPSSAVFRSFDKLLMLADGHVVYFGNPVDSLQYLKQQQYECPGGYNAADHWMDLLVTDSAIDEDTTSNGGGSMLEAKRKLIAAWDNDSVADDIEKGGHENQSFLDAEDDGTIETNEKKYNATWLTQFWVLTHRSMKNSRSAVFTLMNVIKAVGVGIVTGLIWFQNENTEKTVIDRSAYFFFTMSFWVFDAMFTALMTFPSERQIIFKERASGSYHLSAYFMAKTISEAPTRLSLPIFYMIISYWLAMINPRFVVFLGTTFCTMLSVLAGESLGLLVGASVMDPDRAMTLTVVLSLALLLVGGFFVDNMPSFIQWVKYLSPFKYSFDSSLQMVFDRDVPCDGSGVLELICGGRSEGHATSEEVNDFLGVQGSIGFNIGILILIFLVPRYGAYWFLNRKKGGERGA